MRLVCFREKIRDKTSSFETFKGQYFIFGILDGLFLLGVKGQATISRKYKGQRRDKTSQIWVKFKGQD